MRDGTEMDYDGLRDAAREALEADDVTQRAVADALGVTEGAVSNAKREAGPKRATLQRRILEHLTPYRIEERVIFKAHRDEPDA
jgi:transcriptional regulator with XRE-family HTH domain